MTTQNKRTKKDKIWDFVQGQFLVNWFYGKQMKVVFIILAVTLTFITFNYQSTRLLNDINHLKREVRELKFERVSITSTLMGESRISSIQQRLQEEEIEINIPKSAPIIVEK